MKHGQSLKLNQACRGEETQYSKCEMAKCGKCHPINCTLGEWSDWNSGYCTGLCERARTTKEHNNECGMPRNASLVETKGGDACHTCETPAEVDCVCGTIGVIGVLGLALA